MTRATHHQQVHATDPIGPPTILVVDDEELVRMTFATMLERLGYGVLTADSSAGALAAYRRLAGQIKLIIVDYRMPEMTGVELFARLRRIDPAARVVLASGYSPDVDLAKLRHQGLCGFLAKPCSLDQLRQAVAASLA